MEILVDTGPRLGPRGLRLGAETAEGVVAELRSLALAAPSARPAADAPTIRRLGMGWIARLTR